MSKIHHSALAACCLALIIACSALWGGLAHGASPAATPQKVQRLAFAGFYPDNHPAVREVFELWAMDIAEKSKNRLVITCYAPGVFMPEEAHFEAMRRGGTAITQQSVEQAQGRLPLSTFLYVPGSVSSSASGTASFWRMFKNMPEMRKEYENYKLLSLHASAPVQLHLTFQLKDPGGLKGKRILCQDSYMATMLKAAGAKPVISPASAYYRIIAEKKADGAALPFDLVMAHGLDALQFMQSVCLNIHTPPYWTMMNKAVWDALPSETQRVIDAESGESLSMKTAAALDMAAAAGKARMAGRGVHIKELTRAEKELWAATLSPDAYELWLAAMNAAKIKDPEKILERAVRFYSDSEIQYGR